MPDQKEMPKLLDGPRAYDSLTAKDGTVYQDCKVIRAEPSALLVRHRGGMARLSFFDLPESVQQEWGFDPFAAMEHYKAENERERALRWKLFWERQEYESEQARIAAEEKLRDTAEREWIPVEGVVISRIEGGAAIVARCSRVTFQKTKTKSTLGFEIDGPPKRVLVPFAEKAVILHIAVPADHLPPAGGKWRGYVDPIAEGGGSYRYRGSEIPADIYSAVTLEDH
ncbi:MAG: hypothetical protein KDN19_07060 [Verrucomicrobiae bacterium]|nr:hypothetical protein [Verrucomicrobiae bacterium]